MKQMKSTRVLVLLVSILLSTMASGHEPVPGPDFQGCDPMNASGTPYAPLPSFNIMTPGSVIVNWPIGQYDFCAYMDTIYCSLAAVTSLDPRVAEFAGVIQCISADLNGPLNEELEVPFTGNGIPDGQCELGIVAAILNDSTHPLHAEVTAKFQANVFEAKELLIQALMNVPGYGDIRSIIRTAAPYLTRALACLLAGYAVMGDEQTFVLLDEMLDMLAVIGVTPVPGGILSLMDSVPPLGQSGDANGDGFTNRQAFNWYVGHLHYALPDYAPPTVDPNQSITLIGLTGGGSYLTGDTVTLTAVLEEEVLTLPGGPDGFTWYRNSDVIEEATESVLQIIDAQESDSGTYRVAVPVGLLLKGDEDNTMLLTAETVVDLETLIPIPAGNMWTWLFTVLCIIFSAALSLPTAIRKFHNNR